MRSALLTRKFQRVSPLVSFSDYFLHRKRTVPFLGNVGAEFMIPGTLESVFILGLHFSANSGVQQQQCDFLLRRLREYFLSRKGMIPPRVLVLGDFNCGDPVLGIHSKKQLMTGVVCRFKNELLPPKGESHVLTNILGKMKCKRFTHRVGAIDHLLASPQCAEELLDVHIPELADVNDAVSDHASIIAQFSAPRTGMTPPQDPRWDEQNC
jgi:endonuclease/exonuclease/phosphatase family metal-dependent hydrolase